MSWRDQFRAASFRGVAFWVRSAGTSVGRRTVVHEFPGRDSVVVQDDGRLPRRATLEAYVVGDDYMTERDALRDAFETRGPGRLVHPFWGEMLVSVVGAVELRESLDEGGMARFRVPVLQVDDRIPVFVETDTAEQVQASADVAASALEDDFAGSFTVDGLIQDFRDAAVSVITSATSKINRVRGEIASSLAAIDEVADSVDALADSAADLISDPRSLADGFIDLYGSVIGAIEQVGSAIDDALGRRRVDVTMAAFRDLDAFGDDLQDVPETTPQRRQQAVNQEQLVLLQRAGALIETARVLSVLTFESYDQAASVRDELTAALDEFAGDLAYDTYAAMLDLRADLVRHLNQAAASLPRISTYVPPATMPALVIAHHLYGDATRDEEIVARNVISNPCLVPGGEALEVLADA